MTSTTETETKVETATPKEEVKDQVADAPSADAAAADTDKTSAPASPTKTGTLKKEPAILVHKKDFEKDVVYLYQFVRSPTTPSLSADCLKVENWLRLNGIQYENVDHKMRYKSKKGNLPFVELNGKEIEDVDTIIRELATHFDKTVDDGLTTEQKTLGHALESMLNNHTGWVVRWWRYNHPQDFIEGAQLDIKRTLNSRIPNSILNFVFKIGFKKQLKDAVGYGSGRYTDEEVFENAKKDLKALSDCLGTKDYFFGKEPTLLDSTAFAHLVQFTCVPFGGLKEWMDGETANLNAFVDRIKEKCWSDWDSIVSSLEMNTHLPKKEPAEGEAPADGGDAGAAAATAAATADAAEQAKKDAEAKKAEKKRIAEEKKKEREEKKKKEKEEKERIKKEKEEAAKAKKAAEAEAKAKAAEEAEKAKAEAAEKAKAEEAAKAEAAPAADAAAPAADAAKTEETATKEPEAAATANGGEAPKAEVTAE